MKNYGGNSLEQIISALSASGLKPEWKDSGICRIISVAPDVAFIVTDDYDGNPEDARRRSALISAEIAGMRENAKVMVIAADLWHRSREMVLKRMLAHCGIFSRVFARNCEVRRIGKPEANAFMDAWHSYGAASCRHCYGLFTVRETASRASLGPARCRESRVIPAGTMVAAAEFSNARRLLMDGREVRSYEWVRHASLPDLRVAGGMGKILRKFIDEVRPDDIMSYADLEWSDGEVYRRLGFREAGSRPPVLFAIDPITFIRTPLAGSRKSVSDPAASADLPDLYYQNFGSLKYRLTIQWNQAQSICSEEHRL